MHPFKILEKTRVLWEPFYKVEKHRVCLPNGRETDWFVKINNDAVIVIPITTKGEILLQKTYKHGSGQIIYELCAGLIDDGETWKEAAARELQEETGYQATQYLKLGEVLASPTSTAMKYHMILARDIQSTGSLHLEDAEQIQTHLFPDLKSAEKQLTQGDFMTSSATMAAMWYARNYLKKMERSLPPQL